MYIQIVKFKLRHDASRELFLDLTQQMVAWLQSKPGFVAYELYEGTDCWSDRIVWEDQTLAQDGLQDFLTTAIAKQLIHLVEEGYSSFFGQAVISAVLSSGARNQIHMK